MIPAGFDYEVADSVEHAVELLGREDAKILAGGHSLIPAMPLRIARPSLLSWTSAVWTGSATCTRTATRSRSAR